MENKIKESIVIGFGSIGQRHARLLKELGLGVSLVTKRKVSQFQTFTDVGAALAAKKADYVIVCNQTFEHYQTLRQLEERSFSGIVLVEKPVFEKVYPSHSWPFQVVVGYNLRFHPIIKRVADLVKDKLLYSLHVYCGQYLPSWRKDRDYRSSYSACQKKGGGVLRDLSHELDYVTMIAGHWQRLAATGGKVGNLEIDSDDLFAFLIQTTKCPAVTLQVNYLDLEPRREIILNAYNLSLKADLIAGTIEWGNINTRMDKETYPVLPDQTYIDQHTAVLNKDFNRLCSISQANGILKLIHASEEASEKKVWITNN
ncbi:MAG: Gfo/Idh/MocA family oxidoreductase [Pseudomonadota bacterium]